MAEGGDRGLHDLPNRLSKIKFCVRLVCTTGVHEGAKGGRAVFV